jgi:hypothetical protein
LLPIEHHSVAAGAIARPRRRGTVAAMTILDLDQQLNEMIIAGKSVDAFQKFYAADVIAEENDEPERHGRDAWMQGRAAMEQKIKKFDAKVLAHASHGDVSFSEWEFNIELEGMGAMRMIQVAVRRWKDGKIVRERFYHK